MKGVTLISDMFLLICLLAITVIMTLFIWALIITFQVENYVIVGAGVPQGMITTRGVEINLFLKPSIYDSTLKAFLEYEWKGIRIKRILNAVAIQGKTTVWLDGKTIDATEATNTLLTPEISKDYILKINDIIIASKGQFTSGSTPLEIQKVSTNLFLSNGESAYLQLIVAD